MNKIRAEVFAEQLKRSNGLDVALRIANNNMRGTSPEAWSGLPNSPVYFKKDNRGNSSLNNKKMSNTHGYWTQVFHVLKKKLK
jgi:hypothetical protein